jgi:hypothetical protein
MTATVIIGKLPKQHLLLIIRQVKPYKNNKYDYIVVWSIYNLLRS